MKARMRKDELCWHPRMRKQIMSQRLRNGHAALLVGARRLGIIMQGWMNRDGRIKFQLHHYDLNNPGIHFYMAIGEPIPARFVNKIVTVGGYDRLIGYLKLHVDPDKRYELQQGEVEVEVEEESDG